MEVAGTIIGAVALIAAFKGAVDTVLFIDSFRDKNTGSGYLALRYHIEKTRLQMWGDFYKANDPSKPEQCTLRDRAAFIQEAIILILGEIKSVHGKVDALAEKYQVNPPSMPTGNLDKNLHLNSAMVVEAGRLSEAKHPAKRFLWTIKGKSEFESVVNRLRELNDDLYKLLQPGEAMLLTRTLTSYVLAPITNEDFLRTLRDSRTGSPRLVALSARAKELQQQQSLALSATATDIIREDLKRWPGAPTTGLLTSSNSISRPVYIEWTTFKTGSGADEQQTKRISSLCHMLEQVGDPALRLLPCLGMFDDLEYELVHSAKRLGFVFGLPASKMYEGNLRDTPPKSLRDMIQDQKEIPALGDRFRLAYDLASAFSLFHAAGWLHKGFHSANIIFLHCADDARLLIEQPFITGFQYSRPSSWATIAPYASLKDEMLQYYYHPDAAKGFTKKLDLYSLGVVLCEIGRWELVSKSVSAEKRVKFQSREWSRDFMSSHMLDDLGWRMGRSYQSAVRTLLSCSLPSDDDDDLFSQQFFEKVLTPLEACNA